MSDSDRETRPSRSEDDHGRERVVGLPDDPDAPARGVDETDDPIPEPNEPA